MAATTTYSTWINGILQNRFRPSIDERSFARYSAAPPACSPFTSSKPRSTCSGVKKAVTAPRASKKAKALERGVDLNSSNEREGFLNISMHVLKSEIVSFNWTSSHARACAKMMAALG